MMRAIWVLLLLALMAVLMAVSIPFYFVSVVLMKAVTWWHRRLYYPVVVEKRHTLGEPRWKPIDLALGIMPPVAEGWLEPVGITVGPDNQDFVEKVPPPTFGLILHCPSCAARHIDEGEWITRPHSWHRCSACNYTWQPAPFWTIGVERQPAACEVGEGNHDCCGTDALAVR